MVLILCLIVDCQVKKAMKSETNEFQGEDSVTIDISKNIAELEGLFEDFENLSSETDDVINGLNRLGWFYNKLSTSLNKIKNLIDQTEIKYAELKNENNSLRELIEIDKDKLRAFIDLREKSLKWRNFKEGILFELIAAAIVGLLTALITWRIAKYKLTKTS